MIIRKKKRVDVNGQEEKGPVMGRGKEKMLS